MPMNTLYEKEITAKWRAWSSNMWEHLQCSSSPNCSKSGLYFTVIPGMFSCHFYVIVLVVSAIIFNVWQSLTRDIYEELLLLHALLNLLLNLFFLQQVQNGKRCEARFI